MTKKRFEHEIKKVIDQLAERDAMIAERDAMIAECHAVIADRDTQIAKLSQDLALLRSEFESFLRGRPRLPRVPKGQGLLFGDSSIDPSHDGERAEDEDPEGKEEKPDDDSESKRARKPKRKRGKNKIDTTGLPREARVHELSEDQRICPTTGLLLVPIGEKVTEELDYRRGGLVVIENRSVIYGLSPKDAQERQAAELVAPGPSRAVAGCIASASLLAWLLVQKYANHIPLYRQEKIFGRDGLRLPRQTLCDWALAAAEALEPIVQYLLRRIRAGPVLQIDDTPVQCQGGHGEKNFQARLWAFINPKVNAVVYRFTPGRASDTLAEELGDFVGTLVGDAYRGNRRAAELVAAQRQSVDETEDQRIRVAGCWAHVTRKFREVQDAPSVAKLFCEDIRALFEIEKEAKDTAVASEAERPSVTLRLRTEKSRNLVSRILARARRMKDDFSESGDLSKAIHYLLNQKRLLVRFLKDGHVPIDNNACERAIRPIAIGRRNWLFAGSMRGGRAAAVIYSLIESCKQVDIDPVDYLASVLQQLSTEPDIEGLIPENWSPAKVQKRQPLLALHS